MILTKRLLVAWLLGGILGILVAGCKDRDAGPGGECYGAGWESDGTGTNPDLRFSFAILTDLHIGEGIDDFGSEGYDDVDDGADSNEVIENVESAVEGINASIDAYDIRFVMVLGDLTGSGERSEYARARQLLDRLAVPYFPLIGNHDMWPYYKTADGSNIEAAGPIGDVYFTEVFGDHFEALAAEFPDLAHTMTPTHNPEHDLTSTFINFAFTYMGYDFVSLDLVTRAHAPPGYPGIGPEAALHDFSGGSWPWFTDHVGDNPCRSDGNILVFLHHPPMDWSLFGMNETDLAKMNDFLVNGGYGSSVYGFFAGHYHIDLEYTAFDDQVILVTSANKEGIPARVVQVLEGGRIDFNTFL